MVEKVLAGLAQAGFTAESEDSREETAEPQEATVPEDSAEAAAKRAGSSHRGDGSRAAGNSHRRAGDGGREETRTAGGGHRAYGVAAEGGFHGCRAGEPAEAGGRQGRPDQKALAVETLPVEADEEKVSFPGS